MPDQKKKEVFYHQEATTVFMQHLSRLFVPSRSRRPPSRATHEVPSHSPDSLPSTNFCSRLFQPSHHLPLLLRPYRSQLHVAGRRRRAATAAAARATAGQRRRE